MGFLWEVQWRIAVWSLGEQARKIVDERGDEREWDRSGCG
jgi:hypothetical protein